MRGPAVSHSADEAGRHEEARLVLQAQRGELGAFDQLVLRHQQTVFAVAVRMLGDRDEAQDAAQDAFVQAYRHLAEFRREAKFSTWLVAITMNLCRNRRRWWARRRRVIAASTDEPVAKDEGGAGHDAPDPGPSPSAEALRRERERLLREALQGMDADDRAVIVLRDLEGHDYQEIAGMLHTKVGTVKSRLHRARWQLRARLDGKL